jgi:hypothetical protein
MLITIDGESLREHMFSGLENDPDTDHGGES